MAFSLALRPPSPKRSIVPFKITTVSSQALWWPAHPIPNRLVVKASIRGSTRGSHAWLCTSPLRHRPALRCCSASSQGPLFDTSCVVTFVCKILSLHKSGSICVLPPLSSMLLKPQMQYAVSLGSEVKERPYIALVKLSSHAALVKSGRSLKK